MKIVGNTRKAMKVTPSCLFPDFGKYMLSGHALNCAIYTVSVRSEGYSASAGLPVGFLLSMHNIGWCGPGNRFPGDASECLRSSRMPQNASECFGMLQNARMLQNFRILQNAQNAPECFRMLQNASECCRMLQNASECVGPPHPAPPSSPRPPSPTPSPYFLISGSTC